MEKRFYSNGKLLLTAEYVVLDGAKALAIPTTFGQDLIVRTADHGKIHWQSFDSDGVLWFEAMLAFHEISKFMKGEDSIKATLLEILHEARMLNQEFLHETGGIDVITNLSFPRKWGLGTSSTLINNIAQWANVDAFDLLQRSFGGSGYDIACAQNDTAILYRLSEGKPLIEAIDFRPAFSAQLYFVYLNKKQSSKAAIASYYNNGSDVRRAIPAISEITDELINAPSVYSFGRMLENHEAIISDIVEMNTVGDALFPDFDGTVKSLGAWGGDFVLAVSDSDPTEYFKSKGFDTVLKWREMVLNSGVNTAVS